MDGGASIIPYGAPPALSGAWTVGSQACLTLPGPITLYHILASACSPAMATAHRDPCPVCSHSSPLTTLWRQRPEDHVFPAGFPELHLPHAASLPTTDSLVNYLYPLHKCSTQRSRQTSLFCRQSQDMRRGSWAQSLTDVGWKPSPCLHCCVTLGRLLNLPESPL